VSFQANAFQSPGFQVRGGGGGSGWSDDGRATSPEASTLRQRRPHGPTRAVEPERKPPSFKEFLENWKPPPFVVVPDLVRHPAPPPPRSAPALPEQYYPERLGHIAAALDDAEDMQAINAAIDDLPDAGHDAVMQLIHRLKS
jgi:hypothetical protein